MHETELLEEVAAVFLEGAPVRRQCPVGPFHQGIAFEATHDAFGTSYGVFGNFPVQIAGKTGTAQKIVQLPGYTGEQDQSWWCGYGPANDPKLVVCALIENGGHGGTAAAPAAERVFSKFFNVPVPPTGFIHSD